MQLTHSLKPPGFNRWTHQVRNWFQAFAFKSNLYRYAEFSDTFFSPGTMAAALRAAGGVVYAVERVLTVGATVVQA
jgi:acetoin utilization deacetylase AcuC-like enzyme